jgi:hypothetical protein
VLPKVVLDFVVRRFHRAREALLDIRVDPQVVPHPLFEPRRVYAQDCKTRIELGLPADLSLNRSDASGDSGRVRFRWSVALDFFEHEPAIDQLRENRIGRIARTAGRDQPEICDTPHVGQRDQVPVDDAKDAIDDLGARAAGADEKQHNEWQPATATLHQNACPRLM